MKRETGTRAFPLLAAGCFLLLLPGLSQGFDADRTQEMRRRISATCGDSLEALCAGKQGPAQVHCLMDHYEETTAECRALLDELEQRRQNERERRREALAAVCGDSLESLCAGKDGPELVGCLVQNYEETSAECQALLDELEQRMQDERERRREALAAACGDSLELLCAGKDGPELVGCLVQNYEETSAECQALLDEIRAMRKAGRGPRPPE